MPLAIVSLDSVHLRDHTWEMDTPNHKCPADGYCNAHDGDITSCVVCGFHNQGNNTTHCPGPLDRNGDKPLVHRLASALVYYAGLDYRNGTWGWRPARYIYLEDRHEIITIDQPGSIDRLIAYGEARMKAVQNRQSSNNLTPVSLSRLTISVRRATP